MPLGVVEVLLVEGPADALYRTALHLAFDVWRKYSHASVLDRCVTQDCHLAGLNVNLNVRDMRCERMPLVLGGNGCLADYLLVIIVQECCRLLERSGLAFGGKGGIFVRDGVGSGIPHVGETLNHLPAHVLRGLMGGVAGGKCYSAAPSNVGEADRVSVHNHGNDVIEAKTEGFSKLHCHR